MKFSKIVLPVLAATSFTCAAPLEGTSTVVDINARDYAILTEFFELLYDTKAVPAIVKILAGNSITEPILVKAVVAFLKNSDLTDLLTAVDSSGLTVDIILRALQDSSFFPGFYEIIDGLKDGSSESTTPALKTIDTSDLISEVSSVALSYSKLADDGLSSVLSTIKSDLNLGESGGIISYLSPVFELFGVDTGLDSGEEITLSGSATATISSTATGTATTKTSTGSKTSSTATKTSSTSTSTSTSTSSSSSSSSSAWDKLISTIKGWISKREEGSSSLSKRDSEVLDQLVGSLEKSGLAMQVVVELVEDSDNYPFMRDLIISIVQDDAITIDGLKTALESSNLLNDGVIDTLQSSKLGITIS